MMDDEILSRDSKEGSGRNLDYLVIKSGEHILDLECGSGEDTIEAAMLAGADGKAVGLDISGVGIDTAQTDAEGIGVSNAWFIKGDIGDLPFEDCIFDAVMSSCSISHSKRKSRVYREILRVLRHGGRFVISDEVVKFSPVPGVDGNTEAWILCSGGVVTEEKYLEGIMDFGFSNMKVLKRSEYARSGFDCINLTIMAEKV